MSLDLATPRSLAASRMPQWNAFERAFARLARAFHAARGALLWMLLALSLAVIAAACWSWFIKSRENAAIDALVAGQDVPVDSRDASPKLILARAVYLLDRDRLDEVQPLVDQSVLWTDQQTRMRLLYDLANARVRASFAAIEKSDFDKAASLVTLAKDAYREILRLDPEYWDAKYNLDVASRLVRDLPQGVFSDEPQSPPSKRLWTDLPGVPKGEP